MNDYKDLKRLVKKQDVVACIKITSDHAPTTTIGATFRRGKWSVDELHDTIQENVCDTILKRVGEDWEGFHGLVDYPDDIHVLVGVYNCIGKVIVDNQIVSQH